MCNDDSIFTETGMIDNKCPNCNKNLESRPTRKTKCPNCSSFIYVRTRPLDKQQVLVTQKDAELLDAQRHIVASIHDGLIYDQNKIATITNDLKKKYGKQPSEIEVKVSYCEKDQIIHAKDWNWGLYRNARFQIAEFYRATGCIIKALKILFEVCYIDLNGPNNCGGIKNTPELLMEFPPFKPNPQGLAPFIIELINRIITFLSFDEEQCKNSFFEIAKETQIQITTPLSPNDAWMQLKPFLTFR
jgi:DNA-directed RNA polymerase subunit RPC12/RpoP